MKTRLALVEAPIASADADAMRGLARALVPYLKELLEQRQGAELVDVVREVPASKRAVMRACREGRIVGAVRVARRWLAPKSSVMAWLGQLGPRLVAPADEDDDLGPLRAELARPPRKRTRSAG